MLVPKKQFTKSRVIPWFLICISLTHKTYPLKHYVEMAQGHISLSISPFLVIYVNTLKATQRCNNIFNNKLKSANWRQIHLTRIWHIWITFATTWFIFTKQIIFLSLCQKHLFWQTKSSFKSKFDQMPKTIPFPIIKFHPHERTIFAIRGFWSNTKNLTLQFWNS
jgi:hypothetical protein